MVNKKKIVSGSSRLRIGIPTAFGKRGLLMLSLLFFLGFFIDVEAQCAMCRAALESEADTSQAEGVNNGIVYLMAIPYILVGGLFYFIYRKIKG